MAGITHRPSSTAATERQPTSGRVVAVQHRPLCQHALIGPAGAQQLPLVVAVASPRRQRMWLAAELCRLRHVPLTMPTMMHTNQWLTQQHADINLEQLFVTGRVVIQYSCWFTLVSLWIFIVTFLSLAYYMCMLF